MRYLGTRAASLLLTFCLICPVARAAGETSRLTNHSFPFTTEALAARASFFFHDAHSRQLTTKSALYGAMAIIRLGIHRADNAAFALSAGLLAIANPQADHRALIESRKQEFLENGLFANPLTVTWSEKGVPQQMTIRFEFAEDNKETYDAIRETILRPEIAFAKKGVLSKKHAEMVLWLADPANRETLEAYTDPILARNPLKVIARDVATGKVVGFVYPVFIHARNADQLPNTWIGMSQWLENYDPMPRNLNEWVMGDIWFTGGGIAPIATAMLDASYELGKDMGLSRFYAYSNPKALPSFLDKFPHRSAKLSEREYAARIVALLVLESLKLKVEKRPVRTWREFYRLTRRLTYRHAKGLEARDLSLRIIGQLMRTGKTLGLPETPQPQDILRLINELQIPFEKGGYVINDPAITFHLRRGSKLVRIIPDAFPSILGGPGIGAGNAFVMEYSIHLRHRFLMRFGERVGVPYARWRMFRSSPRSALTPSNGSTPMRRLSDRAA